jgi:ABC transporter transmembrane region
VLRWISRSQDICSMYLLAVRPSRFAHPTRRSLAAVAQAGTFAEETISSIRTAQAFSIQGTLSSLFHSYILPCEKADLTASLWTGGGFCCFFFVIYAAYGLGMHFILGTTSLTLLMQPIAFSFGTTLINSNQGLFNLHLKRHVTDARFSQCWRRGQCDLRNYHWHIFSNIDNC